MKEDVKVFSAIGAFVAAAVFLLVLFFKLWNYYVQPSLNMHFIQVDGEANLLREKLAGEALVTKKRLEGEAMLEESKNSRKVKIEEAKAQKEAAQYLNEAEVIRAQGLKESIAIIGGGLQNNKDYLQYLFISSMKEMHEKGTPTVIYLPHDLKVPVQETTRLQNK